MAKARVIPPSKDTSEYRMKVWFKGVHEPADKQPRTYYSYTLPGNAQYGFQKLKNLAMEYVAEGKINIAEIYVNNPKDVSKCIRLVKINSNGTTV